MSHRPHPLRQSYTVDYANLDSVNGVNRNPSTTSSSASSGYSYTSDSYDFGRASTNSSISSVFGPTVRTHKRGMSEVPARQTTSRMTRANTFDEPKANVQDIYNMARQSLRPLPQTPPGAVPSPAPAPSPPSHRTTPTRTTPTPTQTSPTKTPTPPRHSSHSHERGKTIDMGRLSISTGISNGISTGISNGRTSPVIPNGRISPTPLAHPSTARIGTARPTSMVLTRSDSIRPGPMVSHSHSPSVPQSPLAAPDLAQLGRSSTSQLRTLSTLGAAEEFAIAAPTQEVTGLRGRRRLQRVGNAGSRPGDNYGFGGRNWMDKQRQFLQAYEYLCHIGEAKEWIEDIIHQQIPPIVELEEALRDGVTLAEVVEALNPDRKFRIFRHQRLQARHWDNVATFFRYLDQVELPDLFRFELIDLYEKKNIPKVIYCIHALSWLLFRKGIVDFRIGNLVGQLEFEHHELEAMQKGLDKLGISMPSFGNMGADFGVEPEPEPEPEETEEERIDRELAENEEMIIDFQAQMRGALLRLRLGEIMNSLWDSEDWIIDLQSRIRGDWTRQVMEYRLQMKRFSVQLQSAARGYLVRSNLMSRENFWKSKEKNIIKLQSAIRAMNVRHEVQDTRSQLLAAEGPIRSIQAVFKGYLAREKLHVQRQETESSEEPVKGLQSAIRGMLLRGRVEADLHELHGQEPAIGRLQAAAKAMMLRGRMEADMHQLQLQGPAIGQLQAAAKAMMLRGRVEADLHELHGQEPAISRLQAAAKAMMLRGRVEADLHELRGQEPAISRLQAAVRAMLTRDQVSQQRVALEQFVPQWEALQSISRGRKIRSDVETTKSELREHEAEIGSLQSQIRAAAVRREISEKLEALNAEEPAIHEALLAELQSHEEEITSLQALARAMLCRAQLGDLLAELDEHEESVSELQAIAKGFIVRINFEEKRKHFNENMSKVIKIQSFVRGKLQGEAYKSLTTGKNPHDFDFNEEIEFERMRKTVVQQVRQNEMLEQYIDQLDIKIALLVKNKITLDEVVRHQSNFGGHTSNLLANSNMASANQFDLKALNKSSRKKLESYQQLFFNLQTQPQYLARLFKRVREQGTAEKECKRIEHLMMGLFGYAQKRREEYYLLKLMSRSIREEVESCATIQDYLRGNFFWSKLLNNYTRSPRDRKYLRDLLGPLIRDNIIEDPALDLESDPMQIYRSAINNEELRTGRPSRRPLDIPRDLAIKDPETRELFIDHLRDLREICDQFLNALEDFLPRMPYGLRFICLQTFEALCQHFKREPQHQVLQLVSNWVWRFYLQPAVINPEQVGVIEKSLSPLQKRNLSEVAKVLSQIASGRPFGGDNIYLQPLNAFVSDAAERLAQITSDLISVRDAESTFDIDEFNDLYAKNRPTLYIKMTDIFAIHSLVAAELPAICPNRDDILREIMQDLGSAKHNENEMLAAGSSDIQMFLTPKLHDVEDPDAEAKALFMETKRCILYIIRVQTGANLLEILVRPPSEEDERKWAQVLRDDFNNGSNTKGAYSDANMIDVTRMSYFDMKRNALENIMRLEQLGRISKQNYYQDVLNAIALDIRTKSRRRIQRQRELEGVRLTLGNLHEKAKYLEQQRKSYDDYIEQAMATLQKHKGKKRFLLPFTKQYNHQRELERSGRVPKFGSYKYSVRQLFEKGVVVSWQGVPERDWGVINLTISCDEVGIFSLEGSRGHIQIPGASAQVPIEDLLQAQFEAHQFMNQFEGNLRLNVNLLLHLLYKKFYRTQ
ncbi:GTPase-activator protein for Ras-like GTPase [Apiospora hydei]|uniref:GTPase-activator protein for Ras-like GTPase n=1 Tax=Apiospora hydei TaxID=1337664 RepID=A0ABR1VVM4_9PEZI